MPRDTTAQEQQPLGHGVEQQGDVDGELDARGVGCGEEPDSIREDRCLFLLSQDGKIVEGRVLGRGRMLPPLPPAAQVFQLGCVDAQRNDGGRGKQPEDTDREGRFSFSDLRNDRVILWATSTIQPHLVIPSQCSGTVHLPCNTPIVLRVPTRREYWWARPTALPGFYLFIRDGVFLNGSSDIDVVGVPPGSYRVILLTRDRRILEGTFSVTDGGSGELSSRIFRNVTWQ